MNDMRLSVPVRYKTVRGWSGRRYRVRMTEREIRARRVIGLIGCIGLGTPLWILIMAWAANLI